MKLVPSLKLSQKLPLALVGSAIVVGAGIGIASYLIASSALVGQARQNLDTIAFERANQLSTHIREIESDLLKTAKNDNTLFAISNFAKAWRGLDNPSLGGSAAATLQGAFLTGEPDKRIDIDKVVGLTPAYAVNHTHYQPVFREQIEEQGYHDLYLFDLEGHLVYTTRKADDFATLFAEGSGGKYADSTLGKLYRAAAGDDKVGDLLFADFAPYAANGNAPLAFFATPLFDATDAKVGVMAISIAPEGLGKVIGYRQGLGQTGDVIIVGADGLARSDSGFTDDNDVLQPTAYDATIQKAVDGIPGSTELADFRGNAVIAAAAPADVTATLSWAVVAVMNKAEIYGPVAALTTLMTGIGGALLAIVALLGWLFARSVTRPITHLTAGMNALAAGDLDVDVAGADKTDELGEMARAVEVFRANARQVAEMSEGERAASEQRRQDRAEMMQKLQRAFGEVVDAAVSGDFSKRVRTEFPDAELNSLARSVNNLVETVDRGLSETGEVLSALARTDLTQRVTGEYEGAFGRLRDDTNGVCDTLSQIVGSLRATSGQLKTATGEMLSGANDLSERTTKQSATIEETSAAMEQLGSTVGDNARRAEAASAKARAVSATATEGGLVMNKATEAMERITASSAKISNIIGLIEQSGAEVTSGSRLVAEAAQKLVAMLEAAKESSNLIEGIATASRDQAAAIADVGSAVRILDEMTQHNAALVEQTNAAIEQTEAQANELDRIVEVFALDDEEQRRAA